MSQFHRELTVAGSVSDLPEILTFVEACCREAKVYPHLFFDLQLAVEEAAANVIEHAYGGKGGHFHLAFDLSGHTVIITIRDHGRAFSPEAVKLPDLDRPLMDRCAGGFGLHLMRKMMDEVCFSFASGVNTLVMVKRDAVPAGPL